jgi:hypothetical protein
MQTTPLPSPAIGLDQFEQFASMFYNISEQFAVMKNSLQGSTRQSTSTTPQSTSDNDWIGIGSQSSKQGSTRQSTSTTPQSTSDNDWIGIGSQSRTSSEKSDQTTESSSSKLSSQSNRKKRKIPTDHRHFKYQPRTLTLKEFKHRLATRLSDEVIGSELLRKFPSLHAFREEYIIPLKINFPGEKDIDLALMDDAGTFCNGFETSYNAIFVQGCHIPRVPRAPGQPAIPETAERIQYRILIRDLWEILGLLFDMCTEL